jgi:hypothetical protein
MSKNNKNTYYSKDIGIFNKILQCCSYSLNESYTIIDYIDIEIEEIYAKTKQF